MEIKKCLHCSDEIIGKRYDAKFCSNTCKAKHWEGKRSSHKEKKEVNVISKLRGVLDDKENVNVTTTNNALLPIINVVDQRGINFARILPEMKYKRLLDVRMKADMQLSSLKDQLANVDSINGAGWIIGLSGAGVILGSNSHDNKSNMALVGGAIGIIAGLICKDATKNHRENAKERKILELKTEIQNKLTLIQETDNELKIVNEKLKALPELNFAQRQTLLIPQNTIDINDLSGFHTSTEVTEPLFGLQTDVSDISLPKIVSEKIISSQNLKKMDFKALDFQGKWNNLIGNPSVNFHCVLHGMSGEGKSTFAIQFAKYLADNFGRVIYISGEEGFSKTFKDKFTNNNAESKFLDVADLRTFDDIIREVLPEIYNFIFIDSLDNMKIDADKMKVIRERYKNSALITISQSTKDGKMRGSNEIMHDSDMAIKVEKGVAISTKNRFKEKGMTQAVFEK